MIHVLMEIARKAAEYKAGRKPAPGARPPAPPAGQPLPAICAVGFVVAAYLLWLFS